MMTTLRALVIAFSMYSQIPMPQFTWQDKEMKYAFCFFPWVGAAIGGITMFWWWFCGKFSVGNVAFAMIGTAIPLAVTGDFMWMDLWIRWMRSILTSRERKNLRY